MSTDRSLATGRARQTTIDDDRWRAVCARDTSADGTFFYSVRTTGVYCRPSCTARRPRPENVTFHATCADAEAAGYRACKRCRPDRDGTTDTRKVAQACAIVRDAEEMPSLSALAHAVGWSPAHFHRRFKATMGITPKAYMAAELARRVSRGLARAIPVTAAIHEAGYGSTSRFYETAQERLGMSPQAYRRGGEGIAIGYASGLCSLGVVLIGVTARGICAIELGDDEHVALASLKARFPKAQLCHGGADIHRLVAKAIAAVELPQAAASLPLDVQGTAFQEQVWRALRAIPSGATATYADIARSLGRPAASRAVATAIAANPVAVVVPCHRVVRSDGALGGYRWGVDRKKRLLSREAAVMPPKPR